MPVGEDYDRRFDDLAASGAEVHGEADLVAALAGGPRVLDAGCGGGRYARLLASRGANVLGVDLSDAVDKAAELCAAYRERGHALIVQADLLNLPVADAARASGEPARKSRCCRFIAETDRIRAAANCATVNCVREFPSGQGHSSPAR